MERDDTKLARRRVPLAAIGAQRVTVTSATLDPMRVLTVLGVAIDVLLPPTCAGCGLPGDAVCAACTSGLEPIAAPGCGRCGHPWPIPVAHCPECPAAIDVARQAVGYRDPAPAIVAALKDGRRRSLAGQTAAIMAARIPRLPPRVALVPVPAAPDREAERGFNQAALIARELGRLWELPVVEVLARVREAPAQRGSSVTERRAHVRGAFAPVAARAMPPAVCIVDDVHTTGATLAACARALRSGGAARVGAIAFARVIAGSPRATI